MEAFWLGLEKLVTENSPKIYILIVIAFLVNGTCLILPSEKLNEKAKEHMPKVVIGSGIVSTAILLAQYLVSTFSV